MQKKLNPQTVFHNLMKEQKHMNRTNMLQTDIAISLVTLENVTMNVTLAENASICNYDGNCTRKKCMYSHSKKQQNPPGFQNQTFPQIQQTPFLHQGLGGFQPPPANLWNPFVQIMQQMVANQGQTQIHF